MKIADRQKSHGLMEKRSHTDEREREKKERESDRRKTQLSEESDRMVKCVRRKGER